MGSKIVVLMVVLVIFMAFSSFATVGATRLLLRDFGNVSENDNLSKYKTGKFVVAHWFRRLSSGPSGGGGGH